MAQLFKQNREKVFSQMESNSALVLFGNTETYYSLSSSYAFHQSRDFYYLTGIDYPDCAVVMIKSGQGKEVMLFIPPVTELKKTWDSKVLDKDKAESISGIGDTYEKADLFEGIDDILKGSKLLYLMRYPGSGNKEGLNFHNKVASKLSRITQRIPRKNVFSLFEKARQQKSELELQEISIAINHHAEALKATLANRENFKTEKELERDLLYNIWQAGSDYFSFDPIVASEEHSVILHYITNTGSLKNKELLLLDSGVAHNLYCSDITRTFPISGRWKKEKEEVFRAVFKVYKDSLVNIKAGMSILDINKLVARSIEEQLLSLGLLSDADIANQEIRNPAYRKYYMHGASHHLGLEVHDVGTRSEPLPAGAVITLEPGIYVREKGIGVRLENDILITNSGAKELSHQIPMNWKELLDWADSN